MPLFHRASYKCIVKDESSDCCAPHLMQVAVVQVRALIGSNAELLERYDRSLLESYVEVHTLPFVFLDHYTC